MKFSLFTGEKHIVINADDINNYAELVSWLENPNTKKVVYDAKKTYVASHRLGIDIQNISFDIMLAKLNIIDPSLVRLVMFNQLFHCTVKVL